MNAQLAVTHPTSGIINQWWYTCTTAACSLPKEHARVWLNLISEVVRNYRLLLHCKALNEADQFRGRCQQALARARWELMLVSVNGLINKQQFEQLVDLQNLLERSMDNRFSSSDPTIQN